MNRRKFLENSGKNLALAGLVGLAPGSFARDLAHAYEAKKQEHGPGGDMLHRTLGRTGIRVPIVGMGVMNADNPALLRGAWDAGIRFFDTAWYYQNGNNEKMVGSVLRDIGASHEDFTICTKILLLEPVQGKEAKNLFLSRFEESLSRLQMDYVDVLYYHMPQNLDQINDPYIHEAFTELQEQGKIRYKGFSNHSYWPELVKDAVEKNFYDVILLTYNYAMNNDQRVHESLQLAAEAGIGLVAMKTQCRQDWYKKALPAEMQAFYSESNMNTALLKWVLQNEHITAAVPGFTTFSQLKEDISVAYNLSYTEEEKIFLGHKDVKIAMQSVCRLCGSCTGSCPRQVDIPNLMRTHMYSTSYGNPLMARMTLDQIGPGKGLDACKNCTECTSECSNQVPIRERIAELKGIYC